MSLSALRLCGVDESVDIELLQLISGRYPQVEFGVLLDEDRQGTPRYPSMTWVQELCSACFDSCPPVRLSAHLCGRRCAELLSTGNLGWIREHVLPLGFQSLHVCAGRSCGVEIADKEAAARNLAAAIEEVPELDWSLAASEETRELCAAIAVPRAPAAPPTNFAVVFKLGSPLMEDFTIAISSGLRFGTSGDLGPKALLQALRDLRSSLAKDRMMSIDLESSLRSCIDGEDTFDIAKAQAVCRAVDSEGWGASEEAAEVAPPPPPPPNTAASGHPLLAHKLTLLRDHRTTPREFRQLLREITLHIGYEATAQLTTVPRNDIVSPCGPVSASSACKLADSIALVPVLRAGLGMVDAMMELLPNAVVNHIGMFRTPGSSKPIEYYSRLPKDSVADLAFVLEPCIASSKTASAVISKLKGWGAQKVVVLTVIASHQGLCELQRLHPDVTVYTVQVDATLRKDGFIMPGIGNAGDRQFGTPAGNPASHNVYGSVFAEKSPSASPFSPQRRRTSSFAGGSHALMPAGKPVTLVLGETATYNDPSIIPEVVEAEDLAATSLTTHDGAFGPEPVLMRWGAASPELRGPVLATSRHPEQRNAIGAHSGGYSIYRALAVVSNALDESYMPKLDMTTPVARIGPFPAWSDPKAIVTIDPYGHAIPEGFAPWLKKGFDVRPTIAVTKAHIELPECREALREGRLTADGAVLTAEGQSFVTKAAIEPVWYLPGVAERFGVSEDDLRQALFKETNSMYPELLTRRDLKLFLPPIGGLTVYIWGDPEKIPDESVELTCRVHDECNGSDVFGSDICTCRPYLTHAIEECIQTAQRGGTGIVVYFRKEGRALGEVTKYLVYNMRKRQEGGDSAMEYFNCTKEVAGVTDTRFQVMMPDVLRWLGVTKIHRFISMSDMKHDAIVATGIKIVERVEIPPEMVPKDAHVEIAAKVFAGYHAGKSFEAAHDAATLSKVKGREYSSATQYDVSVQEGNGAEGKAQGH